MHTNILTSTVDNKQADVVIPACYYENSDEIIQSGGNINVNSQVLVAPGSSDSISINYMITENQQDFNLATRYLSLLAGENTAFTFQTFADSEEDKGKSSELTRTFNGTLSQYWDALVNLNNKGAGVFVTVQATDLKGRKEDNITNIRAYFCDHDNELPVRDIYHLAPSFIVKSSGNKGHSYWVLTELEVANKGSFQELQKQLISQYKSDAACKDLARVMRLPGFLHQKDKENPSLVLLVEEAGIRYTKEEIASGLNPLPTQQSIIKPIQKSTPSSSNFKELLDKGVEEVKTASSGTRNCTLNKVAYTLSGKAAHLNNPSLLGDIVDNLTTAAKICGLEETEIDATLKSAIDDGFSNPLIPYSKKLNTTNKESSINEKGEQPRKSKVEIMQELVSKLNLQWDVMAEELLLDEKPTTEDHIWKDLCLSSKVDLPFENLCKLIAIKAKDNPYSPVQRYLKFLPTCNNPDDILVELYNAMGVEDELPKVLIRKWLIGAVARAMQPGCQMDNALVLYSSKQGLYKTSFFRELFGEFFQTLGQHKSEVDEIMALYRKWCAEHGEIEYAISNKDISRLKGFITQTEDIFRGSYDRRPSARKRSFVICGTTNQQFFLNDPTGNRRFWVVEITKKINIATIKLIRSKVWSAILSLYNSGEQWWLDDKEDELAREEAENYQQEHPWTEIIESYMERHNPCTIKDIMEGALGIDKSELDNKKKQNAIAKILQQLGCTKKRIGTGTGTIKPTYCSLPR
jgi:predicted P-loop ATPase